MLIERKRQGKQEVDNWPLGTIIRSDQSLSRVRLFGTPWIAARQASLSITNSRSSPRLVSMESVMPSSHLILCRPLLLLPPIPPSIRVFSNESTLRTRYHNRLLLTQVTALSQPVKHVSSQVIKAICISTEVMFIRRCLRSVCVCKLSRFSCVQLFVTLQTVAHRAPLTVGFSRQEYWSRLPCPPPGDLPNPGIEPLSLTSPALAGGFFITDTTWEIGWR